MTDGDAASDDGDAFVGTKAAAAKLDALMSRAGMAKRVRGIHAQMAADDADVDPR